MGGEADRQLGEVSAVERLSCGWGVGLARHAHVVFGRRIDRLEAKLSRFVGPFGPAEGEHTASGQIAAVELIRVPIGLAGG